MYCGQMESIYLSFAWKLGWYPSTVAHLSDISSSLLKEVPLGDQWMERGALPCNRL